jgi:ribonuclease HI
MPDGDRLELAGGERLSTKNRMELMGAIMALEHFAQPSVIKLSSDSRYVVDGIPRRMPKWRKRRCEQVPVRSLRTRRCGSGLSRRTFDTRSHLNGFRASRRGGNERADCLSQQEDIAASRRAIDFAAASWWSNKRQRNDGDEPGCRLPGTGLTRLYEGIDSLKTSSDTWACPIRSAGKPVFLLGSGFSETAVRSGVEPAPTPQILLREIRAN